MFIGNMLEKFKKERGFVIFMYMFCVIKFEGIEKKKEYICYLFFYLCKFLKNFFMKLVN